MVVRGEVSELSGPYVISLSQTVNFSLDNVFPPVQGAIVTLADDVGNSETLTETSPGQYSTTAMQGTIGRSYNLTIAAGGQSYTSESTIYNPVPLDNLSATVEDSKGDPSRYQVNITATFRDRAGEENYYRLVPYINGRPGYATITVVSDYLQDGAAISTAVARGETINPGDTIVVVLQSIDKGVYRYFTTLKEVTRTKTGITAAVPGNPVSNVKNALGYFSAYSSTKKSVVAP